MFLLISFSHFEFNLIKNNCKLTLLLNYRIENVGKYDGPIFVHRPKTTETILTNEMSVIFNVHCRSEKN